MSEEPEGKDELKTGMQRDEESSKPSDDVDLELLEELEPEEAEKEEQDKSDDFFSQDPAELDEPEHLSSQETTESGEQGMPNEDEESNVKGRQKENEGDYGEAVALDEPEGEPQEEEAFEDGGPQEEDGSGDVPDKESTDEADSSSNLAKVSFLRRNLALIAVMAFGMIFVAAGFLLGSKLSNKEASRAEQEVTVVADPVVEEKLAPFYVPLNGKQEEALMAKIDIVVSWARICGIRFKESRHQIRAEVYGFLRDLMAKGINPKKDKTLLEQGATRVLNNALGVTTVKISSMEVELI